MKQSQVDSAPSLELEPPPESASSSNGSPLAKHSFSNVGRKAGIGDLDIDKMRKDEMLQLVHRHNLQIPDFEKLPIPENADSTQGAAGCERSIRVGWATRVVGWQGGVGHDDGDWTAGKTGRREPRFTTCCKL